MAERRNNPRAFAEVVSLDVWRTPFEGDIAEASLHIDVCFFEGRLGPNEMADSPVRFRMSLKRAEIHILRDQGNVIEIPPSSVRRETLVSSRAKTTLTQSGTLKGGLKAGITGGKPALDADLEAKASVELTKRVEKDEELSDMRISHRTLPDGGGYVFLIAPNSSGSLSGSAWDPSIPRMRLRDKNASRKRGDPPEVVVQVHCKREDLIITDVKILDSNFWNGGLLTRNKEIAVEQYIKREILSMGLQCGDLSDAFSRLILGDAISVESK